MAENDPSPEIDSTPGLDQSPTTVQIRRWIADDITRIRTLLTERNETVRTALPPDLVALADKLVTAGDPWSRWLIIGVCVRFTLRVIQTSLAPSDRLRPASVTCAPNIPTLATTERSVVESVATKTKQGTR